jgi:hypothetical protein
MSEEQIGRDELVEMGFGPRSMQALGVAYDPAIPWARAMELAGELGAVEDDFRDVDRFHLESADHPDVLCVNLVEFNIALLRKFPEAVPIVLHGEGGMLSAIAAYVTAIGFEEEEATLDRLLDRCWDLGWKSNDPAVITQFVEDRLADGTLIETPHGLVARSQAT